MNPAIELPAFSLLALGFLFTFAFCWTFDKAWRATLGPAFVKLASIGFGGIRGVGAVHPLSFLKTVNAHVESWTADGLRASERGIVYSINKVIDTAALLFGLPLALALSLYELAQYVRHDAPHAVTKTIRETVVKPVTKTVTVVKATSAAGIKTLTHRVDVLEARVRSLTAAIPHAIPSPIPRLGRLEKTVKAQGKRLTKVEKVLAAGVGVALLTKALTKIGVNYIRCDRNKQLGRGLCKTSPDWVNEFLTGALILAGTTSFVDFVREAQAGYELGIEGLQAFIREL